MNAGKVLLTNKLNKIGIVLIFCTVAVLIVSVLLYTFSGTGIRRVFIFESAASSVMTFEVRYLPHNSVQDDIRIYVDEILLGPIAANARPLFQSGTKIRSCFLRNGTLYIDLSEQAIQIENGRASNMKTASEILKKNIFTNFQSVDIICLYIAGKKVYLIGK